MGITGIGTADGGQNNVYQKTRTVQESGFYERMMREYPGKTEDKAEKNNDSDEMGKNTLTREEMFQLISDRIGEIYEKVKNNDTEPSFQIGNQSFTIKEWDRLIKQFDAVQEEIREQMKEEQAKRQKDATTKVSVKTSTGVTSKDSTDVAKAAGIIGIGGEVASNGVEMEDGDNSVMESLVTESTVCTYPSSNEEEPDKKYITWCL